MQQFDDIRPYHDSEVSTVLNRLFNDQSFIQALARYQYPKLSKYCSVLTKWIVHQIFIRKTKKIHTIHDIQTYIKNYISSMINQSTSGITYSGLDNLKHNQAYTFISNHRDIVLDPTLVNYCLFNNGFNTVRIAIGDNLLQRPFVSDLMRLNKSFIVKRSLQGRREKLDAYKTLSAYIHHSISTQNSIWIAQSEGRAKDGNDKTDAAILKMFNMSYKSKNIPLSDAICAMNIVPIAISYEFDPCDAIKAKELHNTKKYNQYTKSKGEDMSSIIKGIQGDKGKVHVAFGTPLTDQYNHINDVASEIDRQIHNNYRLQASNLIAWYEIAAQHTDISVPNFDTLISDIDISKATTIFHQRMNHINQDYINYFINMYANPVINRYKDHK